MVEEAGSLPASERPSRSDANGLARTSMTTTALTARMTGRRETKPPRRAQKPLP